jgi:hypothetical protein
MKAENCRFEINSIPQGGKQEGEGAVCRGISDILVKVL